MKTSLIISNYNWAPALDVVLRSVGHQVQLPDEVIIADDGSGLTTQNLINDWVSRLDCPLVHVWQPDTDFRLARVRNLAIMKAVGDHLIFIDNDCLLPAHFIKNHRYLTEPNTLVAGGRSLLTQEQTQAILSNPSGDISHVFRAFKHADLSWIPFRRRVPLSWRAVRGCNIGVLKEDILTVSGFDEGYTGWGREDSDLAIRMGKRACKIISGRLAACVSHLFHEEHSRQNLGANEALLSTVMSASAWTPRKSCLRPLDNEG